MNKTLVTTLDVATLHQTSPDSWRAVTEFGDRWGVPVELLVTEVATALDLDGGVPTTKLLLGEIAAGRIDACDYYCGDCGCFYGKVGAAQLGVPLHDMLSETELRDAICGGISLIGAVRDELRHRIAAWSDSDTATTAQLYLMGNNRTPVERALLSFLVAPGHTAETNEFLSVLRDILLAYIAANVAVR